VGAAVAASVAGVAYIQWAMKLDPFARYRPDENRSMAQQIGVRLEDVKLLHWAKGKLALQCEVDRIDVRRDRQNMEFVGVRNGVYFAEKNQFNFSGERATYSAGFQQFEVRSGARVWNADLDLKADGLKYRQRIGRLQTTGPVSGRLFDGIVKAENLLYFPETKDFEAGPINWEGKIAKNNLIQEVSGQGSSSLWKIKAVKMSRQGGSEVWTDGTATDGEIIVQAPKLERNVRTDVLTATGGVKYFSKKANLLCDQAVVYRREKRAVLTGSVTMLVKPEDRQTLEVSEIQPFRPMVPDEIAASRPKPPSQMTEEEKRQNEELRSSKTAKKYPTTITAERIEYWYGQGERRATVTGSPQARQDFPNGRWRHMWTTTAYYDAEKETLKLVSAKDKKTTRVMTSIGDDLVATWFQTSTKEEGEDQWEGEGVEGTVVSDDDEINRRDPPGNRPPPANPRLRGPIGRRA
jgi:hypothetical protein